MKDRLVTKKDVEAEIRRVYNRITWRPHRAAHIKRSKLNTHFIYCLDIFGWSSASIKARYPSLDIMDIVQAIMFERDNTPKRLLEWGIKIPEVTIENSPSRFFP